ncbi:MAG: helix-turn-helix transcriptional regulator [Pseudomonadota bacterium]
MLDQERAFPAFGQRLRRQRRACGMKQAALADLLRVNQATVSRWECGTYAPGGDIQRQVFDALGQIRTDDATLRRLVERSIDCVHLVEEASHICLAYSPNRARDWGTSRRAMLGVSLWQFATDEIRQAESELADAGWWDDAAPAPKLFVTSGAVHDPITISAGDILWERLYLSDGTPVRLVSGRGPV